MEHRTRKIALIHVAKRACGLNDDEYRALLYGACGVTSAKDIVSDEQLGAVMRAFAHVGWHGRVSVDSASVYTASAAWGCSEKQRNMIVSLWYERARNRSMAALRAFIERTAGVSHERFLSVSIASDVIVALYKLKKREEHNDGTVQRV